MSAYPTLRTKSNDGQVLDDGREIDIASNGAPRGRVLFTATKRTIPVTHEGLTAAELATHEAHYAAHRAVSFSYTDPAKAVTYTVIYGARKPVHTPVPVGRWDVSFELVEV